MLRHLDPAGGGMKFMLVFFLLVANANAFFRHICHGEVGIGRIDPIVTPGAASAHCHGIHGASNMALDVSYDELLASNCTSCSVRQDKSAYWSPYLYFQHANGTLQMVLKSGGLTVYYFTERPSDIPQETPIVAFPPGFRMIAGSNFKRAYYNGTEKQVKPSRKTTWTEHDQEQQARLENALGFNCLHYTAGFNEDALARHEMPDKTFIDTYCTDGIRAELMFPSCWNGELDSPNHADHVAYPVMPRNGPCPPGYDQRLPPLFFETIYQTNLFNGTPGEFVFANGDPTGNGYHGDFINGWEDGVLQAAINDPQCTHLGSSGEQSDCPVLQIKPDDEVVNCKMEIPEILRAESIDIVELLPGNPGIQGGPGFAVPNDQTTPATVAPTIEPTQIASGTAIVPPPSVPPYPANGTNVTTPAPTAAPATTGTNEVMTLTEYRIHGNTTIQIIVLQEVVVTTTTVTVVGTGAPASMPNSTVAPLAIGPVKRHGHSHGRIHV